MSRTIKPLLLALCLFCLALTAFGQQSKFSKIRIYEGKKYIKALYNAGVAMDHLEQEKDALIGFFSEAEFAHIKKTGCRYDVLVDDMLADFLQNNANQLPTMQGRPCASPADTITTPKDFKLGKMGGYFTLSELQGHLDNMAAKYPKLITKRAPVGVFKTSEGRSLEFVKISDNPTADERNTETQILYTSLTHAREPMGLSQLVFFMYYLLENYEKNSHVKHLVNNFELVFMPCLNPDGYVYNETIAPAGGGMWRKNRRVVGRNFGVDLNRNFGVGWGGEGSSEDPSSDIYRGTSAFSEPETQAYKWFIEQNNFKIALNYHTFSNLLLFPYGYTFDQCKDHEAYTKVSKTLVSVCDYTNQPSNALYLASGVSDDWLYDQMKVMGMTPEVGEAFWLTSDNIEPTCKKLVWKNLALPLMVNGYTEFLHNFSANELPEGKSDLPFSITPIGFKSASKVTVSLSSTNKNVVCGPPVTFESLQAFESAAGSLSLEVLNTAKDAEVITLFFKVTDGITDFSYKATKIYTPEFENRLIFEDKFADGNNWILSSGWGVATNQSSSAPSSLSDSPTGNYRRNMSTPVYMRNSLNLAPYTNAYLSFKIKYDLNVINKADYFQIVITDNAECYKILNGNLATGNEEFDKGYLGKSDWVTQTIDISEFTGGPLNVYLYLNTDGSDDADGVYIDDLQVFSRIKKDSSPTGLNDPALEASIRLYPNPSTDKILLDLPQNLNKSMSIRIRNSAGQLVKTFDYQNPQQFLELATGLLPAGVYSLELQTGERIAIKRFVKE